MYEIEIFNQHMFVELEFADSHWRAFKHAEVDYDFATSAMAAVVQHIGRNLTLPQSLTRQIAELRMANGSTMQFSADRIGEVFDGYAGRD